MARSIIRVSIVFLLFLILLGCDFMKDSYHQQPTINGSALISKINLTDSTYTNPSSRSVIDNETTLANEHIELWLMPTIRGNDEPIAHWNVYSIKKFSMLPDGSYEIPLEEFPESTSVVFIVDTEAPDDFEVLGFLTLKIDDNHSIIEFPPRSEITGTIEFGEVEISDVTTYLSSSEKTLEDNEGAFNENALERLQQDVIFQNASLMAVNVLKNTDFNGVEDYFAVSISIEYFTELDRAINTSSDVIWEPLGIDIYSNNNSARASLFTPNGENLHGEGVFVNAFGPQSAVQWGVRIPLEKFNEEAKPRELWQLRSENGQVLAEFDLSVAMLTDDSGYPIIPLVSPTYEEVDSNIEILNFNWFHFMPDGTTRVELDNQSALDRIIGKQEFWFQKNSNTHEEITVTYMYREPGEGGFGGMNGDIVTSYDFVPSLPVDRFYKNMSMGYRFTLFRCRTGWYQD